MEFKATDVNAEVISDNSCKKTTKGDEEMIEVVFENRKGIYCSTMPCLSITDCSAQSEHNAAEKKAKSSQSTRTQMRIWGMLSPEDEEAGFGLFLDSECYVLMLYCGDKLMALFDPYDYTLPELNEVLENVMQAIRQNPVVVCTNRIFWSQN